MSNNCGKERVVLFCKMKSRMILIQKEMEKEGRNDLLGGTGSSGVPLGKVGLKRIQIIIK